MKGLLFVLMILVLPLYSSAQINFGVGMAFSNDFFQSVSNPVNESEEKIRNLLISPSFGPKFYFGTSQLSLSLQANIGISPISFDWGEYKGMGVAYAPILAGINYGGLSGFATDRSEWGASVAYGYHFSLTDLYFRDSDFRDMQRDLFYPSFIQFAGGFGGKGAALYLYSRIGIDHSEGRIFSFGITLEVNFLERRKWRD
ncbi:MAG: hypothetical protein EA362_05745 [Saprospirales bacterium]|nr:MAG: hypothetical protein EA362_05745 [Saprospirales bacterium]